MRVVDIAGRLQTAGTWAETAEAEADAQALLRHTRAGLRRMLAGNEAFHVDQMATPLIDEEYKAALLAGPADMVADCAPVGAAPDVWHTEAPSQPGVYLTRPADSCHAIPRHRWWDGDAWHQNHERENATMDQVRATPVRELVFGPLVWLRLICADTPPIPGWRPGDQVPEGERTGMWHCLDAHLGPSYAMPAEEWNFGSGDSFRPAAPGVREGDSYDEARYAKGAA